MKRTVLVFFLMAAAAFLAACAGKGEKQAVIELEGDPDAGYSWTYTMSPEKIVRESAKGYRQKPEDEGRAGAGNTFLFVFEAVMPGETELRFSYERPWENGEPERTAVYILKVNPDETITVRKKS